MAPTQPELLTPNPHQIDLWFCFEDDISLDQLQIYRDQLLNAQERARELRFHFAERWLGPELAGKAYSPHG